MLIHHGAGIGWFAPLLEEPALARSHLVVTCPGSSRPRASSPDGCGTTVERGADALRASGRIGVETAAALQEEARRRSSAGEFFGHIAYASLLSRKPA